MNIRRSQSKWIGKRSTTDKLMPTKSDFDAAKVESLFQDYKAQDEDYIDAPGVMGFVTDLELSAEDVLYHKYFLFRC